MNKCVILAAVVVTLAACQPISKQAQAEMAKPVNCATAQGDLRMLQSEKASTAREIEAGVSAVFPIGLVANVASGTEGASGKVATGDYNKALDKKMAEIKSTCGIN